MEGRLSTAGAYRAAVQAALQAQVMPVQTTICFCREV